MSLPLSGVPRILTAKMTASADDALAVLSPRGIWNAGELVMAALRARGEPLSVFVDPVAWKIYATDNNDAKAGFLAAIPLDFARLTVAPDAPGFIAKWSVVDSTNWEDVSAYFHAVNRRTLVQVVNAFVRDDGGTFAIVDQDAGTVALIRPVNAFAASVALEAVDGQGFTAGYQLAAKDTNRLTFE